MGSATQWRWPTVAAAFVLSLGAMVGAQRLVWERQRQPAFERLRQMPGVERAWVGPDGGARALWVKVAPGDDLPGLVAALQQLAATGDMGRVDEVVLLDGRTPALAAAYRSLALVVQEGAASGAFTEMAARLEEAAARAGVRETRVWVDSRRVYVVLRDDSGYLVDLIDRPQPAGAGSSRPEVGVRVAVEAPYTAPGAGPRSGGGETRP